MLVNSAEETFTVTLENFEGLKTGTERDSWCEDGRMMVQDAMIAKKS